MASYIKTKRSPGMRTYVFKVVIEQDKDGRWTAECPMLKGCATWGETREEALKNIHEAVEAYVEDMKLAGRRISGAEEIMHMAAVSIAM